MRTRSIAVASGMELSELLGSLERITGYCSMCGHACRVRIHLGGMPTNQPSEHMQASGRNSWLVVACSRRYRGVA